MNYQELINNTINNVKVCAAALHDSPKSRASLIHRQIGYVEGMMVANQDLISGNIKEAEAFVAFQGEMEKML